MDRLGGNFGPHDADDQTDYDLSDDGHTDAPPSPVGQDERRMQVRAYNHWASQLGDRNFPHIEDLVPEDMSDFGPFSVLLDFSLGIENPAVQYVGARIAEECDLADHGIETLSDVPSRSLLSRITDHYMQILANQAPIGFEAEFVNQRGATVLYRGILLPYSSDNETIDFIYGVINWKEVADKDTADALLLEIDQALGDYTEDTVESVETAESLTRPAPVEVEAEVSWDEEDILDLGNAELVEMVEASEGALPEPSFGQYRERELETVSASPLAANGKAGRAFDALGNPIGAGAHLDHGGDFSDEDDAGSYDGGLKTAADYGLPEWDDEPEAEDVDDLIDPLADEEVSSSLTSLVSNGMRTKKAVDLSVTLPRSTLPEAYDGEPVELHAYNPRDYEPAPGVLPQDSFEPQAEPEVTQAPEPVHIPVEELARLDLDNVADEPAPAEVDEEEDYILAISSEAAPEGLYDCLASARELAQAALSNEDRSRKALYAAVERAYDFSFEADASPEDYAELISDNGLTVQDRAPMTPIVKLVFGAEYDKTRLTEYAAVLMHARRTGVERGLVVDWLRKADGGLKGIVNAERRARKEEQGKPVDDGNGVRSALARKLRKLDAVSFGDLPADGAEFALVMVRRNDDGELIVIGEVPEDVPLLEKAARKLLG